MAGAATRDRGGRAGTRGDCAEEAGPARPAVGAGLPWRADAGGLRPPWGRGGRRRRGWAEARVRSGCRPGGAWSLRHPGGGLRAAAGAGKFPPARRHFRQLRAPPLPGRCCVLRAGSRRRHSGRAGPALPLRGRRLRAPANGTRAPGPSSRFRAPTPLPRPFARSPSGPRPLPALRSQAPRRCGPSAPAGALGGDPVPCCAPGSLWSVGGDTKGSSTLWTRGYKPAFPCPKV